jgi:hypothetical protein
MNEGYLEKLRMHLFLTLSLVSGTSAETGVFMRYPLFCYFHQEQRFWV